MLSKIISGGQTGADRAALDAGLETGFPIGGACPAGRMAEDGPIGDVYPLVEISGGYRQRTRKNVEESDGTAVFYKSYLKGGTELTVLLCIRLGKPHKLIDIELVSPKVAATLLVDFITASGINVLNVAGPRQSGCPEIYGYVKQAMGLVIKRSKEHP
ncbi:putative molybdenum carrier protein [Microbulbifer rhizosphaerae]|uniref:Molybdenum carrier n=1 Tax=Microbulbifer rhizosphaerae TaxID=1562603 RepID=A0A7W4WCM9_9GAMM|nr:putative molybdenum carrier protein [Microbulbifer rhizosphaerae]MBB3061745.1 hypothetical protein [Microbulbifer rhizosphaerae]